MDRGTWDRSDVTFRWLRTQGYCGSIVRTTKQNNVLAVGLVLILTGIGIGERRGLPTR